METQHKEFEKPIFEEKQKAYKNKVMVLLFFTISFVIVITFPQQKLSLEHIITSSSLVILLTFLSTFFTLKTKVFSDSIQITMLPFIIKKTIKKRDILKAEDVKYSPLLDWGGWGIRLNFKGIAYNMYGNRGVKLTMKSGRIILLGSQKSYLLYDAILRKQ